ncbi:hypothetical protein B0H13DRAFT_1918020 [Mycena leptocephala]|nr:hypothetical protein B0H13DRAFT_1918020 [Mycena leptocephala]
MPQKRKRTQKTRKRVAREHRQNLRLWAEGPREDILTPHIAPYADALDRSWRDEREYLQSVCNEFHQRISWRLADHEQPEIPLAAYNPDSDDSEELDDEEMKEKRTRITLLNARIRHWLKYRVHRLCKQLRPKLDGSKDGWAVLLAKLSGTTSLPKARQAYQQFMRERDGYRERAQEEAKATRAAYNAEFKKPPSRAPEDRQKCIDNVGTFLAPILQGIAERTGLHSVVILGGPVPKYGGDLRTLFVSYGRNRSGSRPGAHFPQWRPDRFNETLTLMKEYLATAFSPQDIAESALPEPLAGAKYTIPESDHEEDEPSEEDDSSDNSNEDSEDTDKEAPPKKRTKSSKTGQGSKPATSTSKPKPRPQPTPLTFEQRRQQNIARTQALLAPLAAEIRADLTDIVSKFPKKTKTKNPPPKRKQPAEAELPAAAPRKSRRLNPGTPLAPTANSTPVPPLTQDPAAATPDPASATQDPPAKPLLPPPPASTPVPPSTQDPAAATPDPASATQDPPANPLLPPPPASTPIPPSTQDPAAATPDPASATQDPLANPLPPPPASTPVPSSTQDPPANPPLPPPPASIPVPPSTQGTDTSPQLAPVAVQVAVCVPDDAPKWLHDCVELLLAQDLGGHFRALVATLIRLETAFGFNGGRAKTKKIPAIKNIQKYADEWGKWWGRLQPAWRERDRDGRWRTGGDTLYGPANEWDALDCPGVNGCLSLVASLYFWGACTDQLPLIKERWDSAVQDVTWMLEGLAVSM